MNMRFWRKKPRTYPKATLTGGPQMAWQSDSGDLYVICVAFKGADTHEPFSVARLDDKYTVTLTLSENDS